MATALLCAALVATTWALAPQFAALVFAAVVCAIVAVSWFAFARGGLLIDPTYPAFSAAAVYFTGVSTLYAVKRHQEREIRAAFGRFVSPAVVARLAEMPGALELGGLQRELTLLFCDIRSFTTISEGFNASELTHFLNQYLTPMTDAILDAAGTVDKYMGDAIVAFWNAPLDDPDHARHAVGAALAMRGRSSTLNEGWRKRAEAEERSFKPVRFGIGLNSGECCVGNLGSLRRFDYSAIGDEVNVASRLEGACKIFEVDIIGSETTRAEAPDFAWLEIDSVLVKGKTRPVGLYALAGDAALAESEEFEHLSRIHSAMLTAYRSRDFRSAATMAKEAAPARRRRPRPLFIQPAPLQPIGGKRARPGLAPADRARRKIAADLRTRIERRGLRGAFGRARRRPFRERTRRPRDAARSDRRAARQTPPRRS